MAPDDGEFPVLSPLGSRSEQHVISDKLELQKALKTAREERDARFRKRALFGAFVAGVIACDLVYGGRLCHWCLVKMDRMIHREVNPYYDD